MQWPLWFPARTCCLALLDLLGRAVDEHVQGPDHTGDGDDMERHGAHELPALTGRHLQLLPLRRQDAEREGEARGIQDTKGVSTLVGKNGFPSPVPKLDGVPPIPKVILFQPLGFSQVPGTGILSRANFLCNEKKLSSK